ncbi:hypothetical protein NQ318_016776 [Aromia moschata]|uniref:Uncharacterized protein n=1 Tax=Aromia moschata TaxID=1265417 RepID=A0AAV8Y4X4_9CUCU|nr:hypothetical protein NQ318_016776 [Aromia moschata]
MSPTSTNLLLLRVLLLLWVICAVMSQASRRDVRRIVIRDLVPRGQKGHGHVRGHRSVGRGHSERDRKRGRKTKGKKHRHSSEEDVTSSEDVDASYREDSTRESSFEDKVPSHKVHKTHRHSKTPRHATRSPHFSGFSSLDYEPTRLEPYRDESSLNDHGNWIPLSSEHMLQSTSPEEYRTGRKKKKDSRHRKNYVQSLKPPPLEITSSYPLQFDAVSLFPHQLTGFSNPFANWNYNQKVFQSNPPLIGTIEQPQLQMDGTGRLKNQRTSYEDQDLMPEASNVKTVINVPDTDSKEDAKIDTANVKGKIYDHNYF